MKSSSHFAGRTMGFFAIALAAIFVLCAQAGAGEVEKSVVRLAVVNTPYQSGLIGSLVPAFEKASGLKVEVYSGSDVYRQAEQGRVDIIISHYGKAPVEDFVTSGKGFWPRPVFSNQMVIIGPKDDPARIRGMTDPFAAMKKIAGSGAPFVSSASPTSRYLTETLMAGAGNPDRGAWFIETRQSRGRAVRLAEEKGAYTVWGAFPFERFRGKRDTSLDALVWDSPLFQRVMATILVNPDKFPGTNIEGARALEAYLLSPSTQAAIAAYREPGLDRQTWWPAGRDNNPAQLLGLPGDDGNDD